jgi:L-2-hydroxyglutarate oxidase LhgO
MAERLDCVIVGAGVVGLAIGRSLALAGREVIVLEAESHIGMHTSSRNSEVIHAGIYYPEDSLKARLCVQGKDMLYAYCEQRGVSHRCLGKIIVAPKGGDLDRLEEIKTQAVRNGVMDLAFLSIDEVRELEPDVVCGGGLLSPSTGIVDSHELMMALQADIEGQGGVVVCDSEVTKLKVGGKGLGFESGGETFTCKTLVNSAGLWAAELVESLMSDRGHGPLLRQRDVSNRGHGPLQRQRDVSNRGHGPLLRQRDVSNRGHGPLQRQRDVSNRGHGALQRQRDVSNRAHGALQRQRDVSNRAHGALLRRGDVGAPRGRDRGAPKLHLAKGHYFAYRGKSPFTHLVYPLPYGGGLGIHATNDLSGAARFGPDVTWVDSITYDFDESRKPAFVAAIKNYFPALNEEKLTPAYTGIRPKLTGPGQPAADFEIRDESDHGIPGLVNLFGIDSPGLTASLAIGEFVMRLLADRSTAIKLS